MHRTLSSLTTILAFAALPHLALATTFTWSGQSTTFSNPASWLPPAPTPPGNPTDSLLFLQPSSADPYTATLDTPAPWSLNSLIFNLTAGAPVTLAAVPGASLAFTGPNPTLSYTGYAPTLNVPVSSTSDLTFTSDNWTALTLTAPLSSTAPASSLIITHSAWLNYTNNTAPAFSQIVLGTPSSPNGGSLVWSVSVADSLPNPLSLGPGPIIFNSGYLQINMLSPPDAASLTATLSNPIIITKNASIAVNTPADSASVSLNVTGPVSLGGTLLIRSDRSYNSPPAAITFSGTITLDQSSSQTLQIGQAIFAPLTTTVASNIIDDPNPAHTAHQPLHLSGNPDSSAPALIISGTANSYSVGTIIDFGTVTLAPNSTLGTGPISVASATLRLSSPANLHPAQTVLLLFAQSALSLPFDQSPYAFLNPASQGVLSLDTTFVTPLDMSLLGNGQMSLGTSQNGIYAASSLRPAADHIYRFAPPTPTNPATSSLTILHSVLIDDAGIPTAAQLSNVTLAASNSYSAGTTVIQDVHANAPASLGTGDVTIGYSFYSDPYSGRLFLSTPNAYAPSAHVSVYGTLAAVGPTGTIPLTTSAPTLYPASILQLGDGLFNNSNRYPDSLPISLRNSNLLLLATGTTTETVGPLSVSGVSVITLQNPANIPSATTLLAPSLSHAPHAVLFLNATNGISPYMFIFGDPTNIPVTFNPADPNHATLQLAAPPAVTHGMVAPWIQSRDFLSTNTLNSDASFLTYTPSGFALPTYVPLPASPGTATEIVDLPSLPDNPPITLAADTAIYALRTSRGIANAPATNTTLHIASGGLIASTNSLLIEPNIDFANAEAFINVTSAASDSGPTCEISGIVTATNGLTKFGPGTLRLSNPNNIISGPLTIHEGTLELASLPSPNSPDPIYLSGSATLNFLQSTILSRPVITSRATNLIPWGTFISAPAGASLTIAAPITGDGQLYLSAGTTVRIAAPIHAATLSIYQWNKELSLAADLSADGAISLAGRITGNATITSPAGFYFSQSTFSPGNSPNDLGQFTFNAPSADLAEQIIFDFDLAPNSLSDHLTSTGPLTIDPLQSDTDFHTLSLHFLSPPTGTYTLITAPSITGQFSSITNLPQGYTIIYAPTSITLAPSVPEPATALLLFACSPFLLFRRRANQRR